MNIELIRSNIDAAMDKIKNDPYSSISKRNARIAIEKLQDALDETYADGDKYKSQMCGRHKHRVALFCEECIREIKTPATGEINGEGHET